MKRAVVYVTALFAIILVACSAELGNVESTTAPEPLNSSPIPPTDTPEPTSCEGIEGNCLWLSFDGKRCVYDGPTDLKPGPVTLIFLNESDGWAATNLIWLLEDKTLEDIIHWIGEEPSMQHQPPWSDYYRGIWKELRPGESIFWEGDLEPGIHALFCVKTAAWPEPINVWFGNTWTIEY